MDTEITAGLQAALGDRYRIARAIGRGGMATVYLVEDLKHNRLVALKVLHPALAAAVGPHRFRREIAIAAQLQHPHILPLLDSGDASPGPLWFTMPYVEGESLRDRLGRDHQLPLADALRITREIADALDYAHRRGVIHRDVKPENILLTADGPALLADFGVARDVLTGTGIGTGTAPTAPRLTDTGLSIGTLEYMSPEQTAGQRDVDARTDVYALGCVLYEMLAGEPPYTGATPQALVARRLVERPLPLRAVRDRIPESVDRAVDIALARSPADRFQSAAAFADALSQTPEPGGRRAFALRDAADAVRRAWRGRGGHHGPNPAGWLRFRPIAVAIGAIVIVAALYEGYAWLDRSRTAAGPIMLAVLPFESVGDSTVGYFTDGVTDEIRGELTQLPRLQVIARASSLRYQRSAKPPEQIARELGVRYLLTGQVRWLRLPSGATIARVEPELTLVTNGRAPTVQWQQQFDIDLSNVFQVQADIATKVASVLNIVLGADQRQTLAERPTGNVIAYDAFLQGDAATQSLTTSDAPSLWRGIGLYNRAVTLDPSFALSWTRLARAYALLYANSTPTPANAEAAQRALARAQALAPGRAETQLALADYAALVEHDDARALVIDSALLARYPDNAQFLGVAAVDERRAGRWEAALAHAQRAEKLDPFSPTSTRQLSGILIRMRRYPDAVIVCRHGLALAPTNLGAIGRMALVSLAQGDLAGAQAVIRTALPSVDTTRLIVSTATNGDLFWVLTDRQQQLLLALPATAFDDDHASWGIRRAEVYWLRGDTGRARAYADTARRVYEDQLKAAPQDYERRLLLGLALAYAGRKDEAIREGERGAALMPLSKNAEQGTYAQQVLARIYMMTGEPERALDHLAPLLVIPHWLTPAWLRIDPTWAPLRGNPRFDRLAGWTGGDRPATAR